VETAARNDRGRGAGRSSPPRALRPLASERGQALVELALVLPLFALILFAVIQFGIVFNNYVTLTDAVRVGAREAAVSRFEADPAGTAEAAVRQAAVNLEQNRLQVTVSSTWLRGNDVVVEAAYPYELNLMGVVVANGELETQVTERVE
jgi:Flp pilus assembly protein TadG